MTNCTCNAFRPDEICDACTLNIWAAELEARIKNLPDTSDINDAIEEELDRRDYISRDNFDPDDVLMKSDFDPDDFVSKQEFDPDDYATKDDISDFVSDDDIADKVTEALEDVSVVQDAAAGAVKAAMQRAEGFATKDAVARFSGLVDHLESRLSAAEEKVAAVPITFTPLSFKQRIHVLFTGRL